MPAVSRSIAGTITVNCVELTNVVASATPFHCATALLTKVVPVNVTVSAAEPAAAEFGASVISTGTGVVIRKIVLLVPPPGAGFETVTRNEPVIVRKLLGTVAVNCVELMNAVVSGWLFHSTTEVLTKLLPVKVSVKAGLPAVTDVGEIEVRPGKGLLMVNVRAAFDVPPPGVGLTTVTDAVPAVKTSVAGTVAVNCVALTKIVVSGVPFHCTTDPFTKLLPFTVRVNAKSPPVAKVGVSEVGKGKGLGAIMFSVKIGEVLPEKLTSPL